MTDSYVEWDVRTGYGMLDAERGRTLAELRELIQSDLDGSQTLDVDLPGLRKALLIIERMERE